MGRRKLDGPYWANLAFIRRLHARLKANGDCREWQGYISKTTGYGQIGYGDKRVISTHRAAWEISHQQSLPPGMDACHTCDNRPCCEPSHLFAGTRMKNMEDARRKGRTLSGERNPAAKLKLAQVLEIIERRKAGRSTRSLGVEYGVGHSVISEICSRRTWRTDLEKASKAFDQLWLL